MAIPPGPRLDLATLREDDVALELRHVAAEVHGHNGGPLAPVPMRVFLAYRRTDSRGAGDGQHCTGKPRARSLLRTGFSPQRLGHGRGAANDQQPQSNEGCCSWCWGPFYHWWHYHICSYYSSFYYRYFLMVLLLVLLLLQLPLLLLLLPLLLLLCYHHYE